METNTVENTSSISIIAAQLIRIDLKCKIAMGGISSLQFLMAISRGYFFKLLQHKCTQFGNIEQIEFFEM